MKRASDEDSTKQSAQGECKMLLARMHLGDCAKKLMTLFVATTIFLTLGCSKKADAPLRLFVAASLSEAANDLAHVYKRTNASGEIELNFASSNALFHQIKASNAADIFLSADPRLIEALQTSDREMRFLTNPLVIVKNEDADFDITGLNDLLQAKVKRVIIGDPKSVPAGRYAKRALGELYEPLKTKTVPALDVRAALRMAEVDVDSVAIVYKTDALSSERVIEEFRFAKAFDAHYAFAIVEKARSLNRQKQVDAFVKLLRSQSAKDIFRRRGFEVMP